MRALGPQGARRRRGPNSLLEHLTEKQVSAGQKETRQQVELFRVRDQQRRWLSMSMFRIVGQQVINGQKVGGVLLRGERMPGAWDVSTFEGNGHREVSARQAIVWHEVSDWSPYVDACGNPLEPKDLTEKEAAADAEEKRQRSLKKAAGRAQTQCRRMIKVSNFREMLTGTYRENQTDLELFKVHLTAFLEAMKYALKKFEYCLSFEKQERGAYHFHAAVNQLPKWVRFKGQKVEGWKLPTLIWRKIVGEDNGLVFVGGKPKWGQSRRRNLSLAKMASYVSKYIMKDYADAPMGAKRYWSSRGNDAPKAVTVRVYGPDLRGVVESLFQCGDGHVIVSHRVGQYLDSYWLCTEPDERHKTLQAS